MSQYAPHQTLNILIRIFGRPVFSLGPYNKPLATMPNGTIREKCGWGWETLIDCICQQQSGAAWLSSMCVYMYVALSLEILIIWTLTTHQLHVIAHLLFETKLLVAFTILAQLIGHFCHCKWLLYSERKRSTTCNEHHLLCCFVKVFYSAQVQSFLLIIY